MRTPTIIRTVRANHITQSTRKQFSIPPSSLPRTFFSPCRNLAQVQGSRDIFPEVWFRGSGSPRRTPEEVGLRSGSPPPDERTIKLGKSKNTSQSQKHSGKLLLTYHLTALRILQSRLPTLLASPLPQEILSPQITLHLFPSTHPHLPTVSGRVGYHAALWTSPVAWGRVPLVGNVKLDIMSERMVKNGSPSKSCNEKLIVRWKTCGKTRGKGMGALYRGIGASEQVDKITEWLGGDARDDEEFCGLFIFEFDEEGRIVSHTIEHAEEGGSWERASKVISVTDWLLRRLGRKEQEVQGLALGYCGNGSGSGERRAKVRRA